MNLNKLANSICKIVHPNQPLVFYKADGQVNLKGVLTPKYQAAVNVVGSIQPLDTNTLKHLESINDTKATEQAFVNFGLSDVKRVPTTGGGDFLQSSDGVFWLVTSVIEDWNEDGWCVVGITQQVTPPDFSASDWR